MSEINSAGCEEGSVKETGSSLPVFFVAGLFMNGAVLCAKGVGLGIDFVALSMG